MKSYVLHWYHIYLLHPDMDRIEATTFQHLYCPEIRNTVRREVCNFDTSQSTKGSNK